MGQHEKLAVVLVAIAVLLAGCAGLGGGDANGEAPALGADDGGADGGGADGADGGSAPEATPAPEAEGARASGDSADGGAGTSTGQSSQGGGDISRLATDRAIIRTGTVTVSVDDFETQRARLEAEVERLGGYVGSSSVQLHQRDNETWRTGTVTLRVPADAFPRMLSYAKDRGEVRAEQTSTTDVTDQLVELDARITNLEEKRSRIRAFYEQAEDTQALLRIEERLADVQGRIEQLKAKQRSLADRVAFSTLTVNLDEPSPAEPTPTPTPDPGRASVIGALQGSAEGLLDLGYSTVLLGAAALPWLLALAGLGIVLALLRRLLSVAGVRAVVPGLGRKSTGAGAEGRPPGGHRGATPPASPGRSTAPDAGADRPIAGDDRPIAGDDRPIAGDDRLDDVVDRPDGDDGAPADRVDEGDAPGEGS